MKKKTIPGIYNYCDRWCERCSFTSRCAVFEDESNLAPEEKDLNNAVFWDNLSGKLSEAIEALHHAATAYGFDLNNFAENDLEEAEREENMRAKNTRHPLHKSSLTYAVSAKQWFEKVQLRDYINDLDKSLELNIKTEAEGADAVKSLKHCTEVVMWYSSFIHVKLGRALSSAVKVDKWAEQCGLQKDSDGSAKIALIAIERSLHAWSMLYNLLLEYQDSILTFLAHLQHLQKMVIQSFPHAMEFVRPGFDEQQKTAGVS